MGIAVSLAELAKAYLDFDAQGRLADTDLRGRLARHMMEARAHALTIARVAEQAKANLNPPAISSLMKIVSTRVGQERSELALEIMGSRGLGWGDEPFTADELAAIRGWLWSKATTIAGGSAEIQNNIIAKRILGLPGVT
jgi:alkylation response protein AidB-like acyl-CoA dehydrogenase